MFEIMDRNIKIKTHNIIEYVEKLCTSINVLDKTNDELMDINEKLMELIEDKNSTIEELAEKLDNMEESKDKEIYELRDRIADLENEIDFIRNGKLNTDREERY